MFLNVTVAIRHIDRQSHVTLCHAARYNCSMRRAQLRQVGGRGRPARRGRRAARQLERPAVLQAITVIDHEHRERHGKGGACRVHAQSGF